MPVGPSIWAIPPASRRLVDQVGAGNAASRSLAGGATQVGAIPANGCPYREFPETFPFHAGQACPLSGKRLLRNEESQAIRPGHRNPI